MPLLILTTFTNDTIKVQPPASALDMIAAIFNKIHRLNDVEP